MERLSEFVDTHPDCYAVGEKDSDIIKKLFNENLNFTPGALLMEYLSKWGCLEYRYIELCGINSGEHYDMIILTKKIMGDCHLLRGYVALEYLGDDLYTLCDENDKVYLYNMSNQDKPKPLGIDIEAYILSVFKDAQ